MSDLFTFFEENRRPADLDALSRCLRHFKQAVAAFTVPCDEGSRVKSIAGAVALSEVFEKLVRCSAVESEYAHLPHEKVIRATKDVCISSCEMGRGGIDPGLAAVFEMLRQVTAWPIERQPSAGRYRMNEVLSNEVISTLDAALFALESVVSRNEDHLFVTRGRVATVRGLSEGAFRKRISSGSEKWPKQRHLQRGRMKRPRAGWWLHEIADQPLLEAPMIRQLRDDPGW